MTAVTLRKPAAKDARTFARLVIESSPMLPHVLGRGFQASLERLFAHPANFFSMRHVTFADADGTPAGMLLGCTHEEKRREDIATSLLVLRESGLELLARLPLLLQLNRYAGRIYPGEYYVSNIAVDSGFRGLGIGKMLMENARETAARQGMQAMALEVDASNPGAKALYERLGYCVTLHYKVKIAGKNKGYYRMTRPVAG